MGGNFASAMMETPSHDKEAVFKAVNFIQFFSYALWSLGCVAESSKRQKTNRTGFKKEMCNGSFVMGNTLIQACACFW